MPVSIGIQGVYGARGLFRNKSDDLPKKLKDFHSGAEL